MFFDYKEIFFDYEVGAEDFSASATIGTLPVQIERVHSGFQI
jgi:hypothetical protein